MIAWLLVAVAGAALCTACDHLHVVAGVLFYAHPVFWRQAWWVPLLFGVASMAAVAGAGTVRRLCRGAPLAPPTSGQLAGDALAFVTAYAFTAYGHALPNVVGAVLIGFWLARVLRGVTPWLVAYSIILGIAGPLFEAFWSSLGLFHYRAPDLLGVPWWLPGIYLHVAFLAAGLERLVGNRGGAV